MPIKINSSANGAREGIEKVDQRLTHIAFIMDGNGRWAQNRGKPREYGHKHGAETFRKITEYCGDIGIRAVTVYAFSSENWKRPAKEVNSIMKLLDKYLDECLDNFSDHDIRIKFIGDMSPFDAKFRKKIDRIEELTKDRGLLLNIALNYGARPEIVNAVNRILDAGIDSVDEATFEKYLYTSHCTDPDLIVRTGGEYRLSNFLLWQAAYSELYFTDCLWPDMDPAEVDKAVKAFYSRKRRYGGV